MASSPTQRTKKHLEGLGYRVDICERVIPYSFIKKDLFGFADLVAVGFGHIAAVQTTTMSNKSERLNKILALDDAKVWLDNGGKILLICWRQLKGKGRQKWWPDTREIIREDYFFFSERITK